MDTSDLLKRYCPVLWLHPQEPCLPVDVKTYMHSAELRLAEQEVWEETYRHVDYQVLLGVGQVTCEKLVKLGQHFPDKKLQLIVPDVDGLNLVNENAAQQLPPIYAVTKRVLNSKGELEAYELTYIFFYSYNAPYELLELWRVGGHAGDWEHLTVRLYPNGELQGVYYNRHRDYDGDWLPANKVPFTNGRIVIFVAKGAHGCYSRKGLQPRIYFLLNDHCDKGKIWKPSTVVKLVPDYDVPSRGSCLKGKHVPAISRSPHASLETEDIKVTQADQWVEYSGYYGTVACPLSDTWCKRAENPVSRGWFKRIFLPFWPGPPAGNNQYPISGKGYSQF